ncbi:hypothetical protein CLPU_2c02170 [Gottschalkia purinilytica]|uniref:DZANK-type domain-containing protein n=1 Tax=Gottschalkia purinilytica TaxID=1503 RepID=A0A0L0WEB3_GOTPU|nr:zinc ribbon domain-containing protein [Gottschalkia purinilytica]KNF09765.1 hypothetical protein CLPU_2c02170 [Gottschalkia purinilytica]
MNDFKEKFHKGISTFQKELKEGKEKIQTSQEVMSLKLKLSEYEDERLNLIYSLGELAYKKMRENELKDTELENTVADITNVDKSIYSILKVIDEKTKSEKSVIICDCGEKLSHQDKFCKGCGMKLDSKEENETIEMISCSKCEEKIVSDSNFCGCCGAKIS